MPDSGTRFEGRSQFWSKNTDFEAPRGFFTPPGAFVRILLGQGVKLVKVDKVGSV